MMHLSRISPIRLLLLVASFCFSAVLSSSNDNKRSRNLRRHVAARESGVHNLFAPANFQEEGKEAAPQATESGGRACNDVIGFISKDEIQRLATFYANLLYGSVSEGIYVDPAIAAAISSVRSDLIVYKVCGGCASLCDALNDDTNQGGNDTPSTPYSSRSYCGRGVYGSNALHSALVMQPYDMANQKVVGGTIKATMHLPGTTFSANKGPSDVFPSSTLETYTSMVVPGTASDIATFLVFTETILPA
ncbi:hypothetical protein ACA910_005445 [Epithemia clementina (nom. ined.)]